jgi:hypothetical protein
VVRVVFFDLGLTLIDDHQRPFPHVADALGTIARFTAGGKPLRSALVSDVDMPAPPPTAAKVKAIFARYLAILDGTGLRPLFEPVSRRVTLSAHAGALKPDAAIFTTALKRLQAPAVPFGECLFVTENPAHVAAARTTLGMQALQFQSADAAGDFDDWRQAPPMIAHLIDGAHGPNTEIALRHHLDTVLGFEAHSFRQERAAHAGAPSTTTVAGTVWAPIDAASDPALQGVHAPFPSEASVRRGPRGQILSVQITRPAADAVAEASTFARSLATHGQIDGPPGPIGRTATHDIETDAQGRRRLVRKRVRAF